MDSESTVLLPKTKWQVTRNVLILVGTLTLSKLVSFLLELALIPISNRLRFYGDSGNILMWIWNGLPDALAALAAAIVVLKIIESRKPVSWVIGLSALYLYTGSLGGWRLIRRWQIPPTTSDYIGIGIKSMMPTLVCLIVAIGSARYFGSHHPASSPGNDNP